MAVDLTAASQGPRPLEHLLRPSGRGDPAVPRAARDHRTIADHAAVLPGLDAIRILDGPPSRADAFRWATPTFAGQVERARRQLEPIWDPSVLVSSFAREASHLRPAAEPITATPGPIRVAYAIRWIEIHARLRLPEWSTWSEEA